MTHKDKAINEDKIRLIKGFKKTMRRLMKENKISQYELQRRTSLGLDTIKSFTRTENYSFPDYETLLVLSEVFNVSPDYLMGYFSENEAPVFYLRNMLIAAKKLNFNIENDEDSLSFILKQSNISKLLENALNYEDYEIDKSAKLIFFHGKIVSEADYYDLKKRLYLYGSFVDFEENEPIYDMQILIKLLKRAQRMEDDYISDDYDELQGRMEEWDSTNGEPQKYKCDVYIDFFDKQEWDISDGYPIKEQMESEKE